ncbi:CocE/NonD family hydrolase [Actinomadura madurae]|uniref:CocE/NonD family hydrolase n=1 Tax=Actinomadura madurae TaxID=1993 RepID=UPI00399A1AD4
MAADQTIETLATKDVPVPLSDGTTLLADVYRPGDDQRYPVILARTPYGKSAPMKQAWPLDVATAGFVLVMQDVRGTAASGGEFTPFVNEAVDGADSVRWCAQQPWSDGRVIMLGGSYLALTQLLAASRPAPGLVAIAPGITPFDFYEDFLYPGGAFHLGTMMWWSHVLSVLQLLRKVGTEDVGALFQSWAQMGDAMSDWQRTMPLTDVPLFRELVPAWGDWLGHPTRDGYWEALSVRDRVPKITVPAMVQGGWFDVFLKGTLDAYTAIRGGAGQGVARERTRLIIGPWSHATGDRVLGELDFGFSSSEMSMQMWPRYLDYFRECLGEGGPVSGAPVKLFVMGANVWRDEQEWPLERAVTTKYYLHSGGGLSAERPLVEATPSTYVYDPRDPVPSTGGRTLLPGDNIAFRAGPRDQRAVEERPDVVCFSTEVLDEDIEVTGPVEVVLHAASSAVDTDWTAKLVDVHPDGRAMSVADGILRARYREGFERPVLMKPGTPYRFVIDLVATSMVFKAGHRIRVEISSSNFPRFDRNPNTGRLPAEELETNMISAEQTLFHDAARPSWIALPIVAS